MTNQSAKLEWRDARVPVSTQFDDPYYSLDNGLAETRHVFVDGNDLFARFRDGFHISELGFGTGLNLLTALHTFRESGTKGRLHFTSFEAFPMAAEDMITAQNAFPELAAVAKDLRPFWESGDTEFTLPDLKFRLIIGDARTTLPTWPERADAWFLDGFSPAKNPELWGEALLIEVARHTVPGGTAATYTAAGHVRRALESGGFTVTRASGFGRKRHMTKAVMPDA